MEKRGFRRITPDSGGEISFNDRGYIAINGNILKSLEIFTSVISFVDQLQCFNIHQKLENLVGIIYFLDGLSYFLNRISDTTRFHWLAKSDKCKCDINKPTYSRWIGDSYLTGHCKCRGEFYVYPIITIQTIVNNSSYTCIANSESKLIGAGTCN